MNDEKKCQCKGCGPSCACGSQTPKAGECCCGPTCTCGPACACPSSCGCASAKKKQ